MANDSSIPAWRIPWTKEPGRLQSMGSQESITAQKLNNHHYPLSLVLAILITVCLGASLVAQLVKNSPAMQETWVQSLGWGDPLEKGKATHSSILAWRIPWTVQSMGSQRVGRNLATFTKLFWYVPVWVNPLWDTLPFLDLDAVSFPRLGKF